MVAPARPQTNDPVTEQSTARLVPRTALPQHVVDAIMAAAEDDGPRPPAIRAGAADATGQPRIAASNVKVILEQVVQRDSAVRVPFTLKAPAVVTVSAEAAPELAEPRPQRPAAPGPDRRALADEIVRDAVATAKKPMDAPDSTRQQVQPAAAKPAVWDAPARLPILQRSDAGPSDTTPRAAQLVAIEAIQPESDEAAVAENPPVQRPAAGMPTPASSKGLPAGRDQEAHPSMRPATSASPALRAGAPGEGDSSSTDDAAAAGSLPNPGDTASGTRTPSTPKSPYIGRGQVAQPSSRPVDAANTGPVPRAGAPGEGDSSSTDDAAAADSHSPPNPDGAASDGTDRPVQGERVSAGGSAGAAAPSSPQPGSAVLAPGAIAAAVTAGAAAGPAPAGAVPAPAAIASAATSGAAPDIAALATAMAASSARGIRHFDIRLDPPELGRVDVHLSVGHDGKAEALLTVDRPDTLELLQRDSATLQRALRDAGLDLSNNSLNFSLKGQQRQGDGGGASMARMRSLPHAVVARAEAANASTPIWNHASDDARLDIRV